MTGMTKGRRKIDIKYIREKSRRHITFSKRKAGIVKKAHELATLTGTDILLLIASEAGTVYYHSTERFRNAIEPPEAKQQIAECLNMTSTNSQKSASDYKFVRMNPPECNCTQIDQLSSASNSPGSPVNRSQSPKYAEDDYDCTTKPTKDAMGRFPSRGPGLVPYSQFPGHLPIERLPQMAHRMKRGMVPDYQSPGPGYAMRPIKMESGCQEEERLGSPSMRMHPMDEEEMIAQRYRTGRIIDPMYAHQHGSGSPIIAQQQLMGGTNISAPAVPPAIHFDMADQRMEIMQDRGYVLQSMSDFPGIRYGRSQYPHRTMLSPPASSPKLDMMQQPMLDMRRNGYAPRGYIYDGGPMSPLSNIVYPYNNEYLQQVHDPGFQEMIVQQQSHSGSTNPENVQNDMGYCYGEQEFN